MVGGRCECMHLFSRDQQALLWTLSEPADPAGKGHCNYLKPDPTPPIVTHWQNIEIHSCMFLASHLFTVTASFCSHPSLFHISPHPVFSPVPSFFPLVQSLLILLQNKHVLFKPLFRYTLGIQPCWTIRTKFKAKLVVQQQF